MSREPGHLIVGGLHARRRVHILHGRSVRMVNEEAQFPRDTGAATARVPPTSTYEIAVWNFGGVNVEFLKPEGWSDAEVFAALIKGYEGCDQ